MYLVRLEPTELFLTGTRTAHQDTRDAGVCINFKKSCAKYKLERQILDIYCKFATNIPPIGFCYLQLKKMLSMLRAVHPHKEPSAPVSRTYNVAEYPVTKSMRQHIKPASLAGTVVSVKLGSDFTLALYFLLVCQQEI